MKKYTVFFSFCLILFFSGAALFAQQGGFTGPSAPPAANTQGVYQAVTVTQLPNLPNNKTTVTLTGNIVQSVGRSSYTFRDSTGDINLKIGTYYWWNLTVSPTDRVQLLVQVEKKRNGRIEVAVKGIRRL